MEITKKPPKSEKKARPRRTARTGQNKVCGIDQEPQAQASKVTSENNDLQKDLKRLYQLTLLKMDANMNWTNAQYKILCDLIKNEIAKVSF